MSVWSEGSPEHVKQRPTTSAYSDEQKERTKRTVMQPKPSQLYVVQIIHKAHIRRRHDALVQFPIVRDWVDRVVKFRTVDVGGIGQRDEVRLPVRVK